MKKKLRFLSGLVIAILAALLFVLLMIFVYFQVPGNSLISLLRNIVVWTVGLPFTLSMWLGSIDFVKEKLCDPYSQATFGCWGEAGSKIATLVHVPIFVLAYYWLWRRGKFGNDRK